MGRNKFIFTYSLPVICWVILAKRRLPNGSLAADMGAMGTNASFIVTEFCKTVNIAIKHWHVVNERVKYQQIVNTYIQWCILHNL
jgi:hypothetical protein